MVSTMREVTDPNVLMQLNQAPASAVASNGLKEVTDPAVLSQLNAQQVSPSPTPDQIPGNTPTGNTQPIETEDPGVTIGKAALGGLQNAAADTLQGAASAVPFILSHIPKIGMSTEEANRQYQDLKEGTDLLRPSGSIAAAVKQLPEVSGGVEGLGNVAGLMTGTGAVGKITPILKAAEGSGLAARLGVGAANQASKGLGNAAVMGSATPGDQAAKEQSALLGAAVVPAVDLLGAGIGAGSKYLSKETTLKKTFSNLTDKLKDKVTPIKENTPLADQSATSTGNLREKVKAEGDTLYDAYKSVPGVPNIKPVVTEIKKVMGKVTKGPTNTIIGVDGSPLVEKQVPSKTPGVSLNKTQKDTLQGYIKDLRLAENTSDILKVKQAMGNDFNIFSGMNANDSTYKAYSTIKDRLDSVMQVHAKANGAEDVLHAANMYNKLELKPLEKFIGKQPIYKMQETKDTHGLATLGNKHLNDALKSEGNAKAYIKFTDGNGAELVEKHVLDKTLSDVLIKENFNPALASSKIKQKIDILKNALPPENLNRLKGITKVLDELNQTKTSIKDLTKAQQSQSGKLGQAAYYGAAPTVGFMFGGVPGAIIGGGLGLGLKMLVHSPAGQKTLEAIGRGNVPTATIKGLIKGLTLFAVQQANSDQDLNQVQD